MDQFVPNGYFLISTALDRLGRELFPSQWTGKEHKARAGLISEDEWLKTKDVPPAKGADAGLATLRSSNSAPAQPKPAQLKPHWTGDPADPSYQEEYKERERYREACNKLLVLLEAGLREAVIWDPFTGRLHQAWPLLWRRHGAGRMIEKGKAPIPHNPNTGTILVKLFGEASVRLKPLPAAKKREVVEALRQKLATESLTRPQQKEFIRNLCQNNSITSREMDQILQEFPVPPGRPRKSDGKV
jgi:hypothetical protein